MVFGGLLVFSIFRFFIPNFVLTATPITSLRTCYFSKSSSDVQRTLLLNNFRFLLARKRGLETVYGERVSQGENKNQMPYKEGKGDTTEIPQAIA